VSVPPPTPYQPYIDPRPYLPNGEGLWVDPGNPKPIPSSLGQTPGPADPLTTLASMFAADAGGGGGTPQTIVVPSGDSGSGGLSGLSLTGLIVLVVVGLGGWLLWRHFHKHKAAA